MALAAKTAARMHFWGMCSMASEWLSWTASHHARQRENRVGMIGNLLATRTPADRRGEDKPFAQKAEGQPGFIRRFHRFRRLQNKDRDWGVGFSSCPNGSLGTR